MKPLGISAEFVLPGKVGGAEFFLRYLLSGFVQTLPEQDSLRLFTSTETFAAIPGKLEIVPPPIRGGNRFIRELISYIWHGRSVRAMIYPNYFTPPWIKTSPVITVIIDAQYRHMPQNFSFQKKLWLRFAHWTTLHLADKVVTVSEFVRQDLLAIYGDKWKDRISVIPIPVSWERFSSTGAPSRMASLPGRFILTVAAQYPHKNLTTLIHAFKRVRLSHPDVSLVMAGQLPENLIGSNRGADLRALVKELDLGDSVRVTGHIPESDLGILYGRADLFVFPSLFEGFGIPPVEALGFGLPVVTTDRTSLPEVTLGMAKYLHDPLDPGEMADAIMEILRNPAKHRKSAEEVRRVREYYDPGTLANRYRTLLIDRAAG